MDDAFRRALRRNALLADVLAEGEAPDVALRARLRAELARTRHRRLAARGAALAAAALLAAALLRPAPPPPPIPPPAAAAAPAFEIVRTGDVAPLLEIVRTPAAGALEIVRTERGALELAGDAELLKASRAVAIVGHPGGPKKLLVAP